MHKQRYSPLAERRLSLRKRIFEVASTVCAINENVCKVVSIIASEYVVNAE